MTLTTEQLQRATQAKSDQLNGCDILGGPIVAKILDVRAGNSEQPVVIDIDSWPQPWKPSKTSLRVLCACWGRDPQQWVGRYAVLYCDETVKFGGEMVGGIRTSHLSHIDGTKKIAVNTTRGKKGTQTVEPYYPQEQSAPVDTGPVYWPEDKFEIQVGRATGAIQSGDKTPDDIIAALEKKALLTAGQKARLQSIRAVEPDPEPALEMEESDDPFTE